MINIKVANKIADFNSIADLADIIWREHYIPITGIGQVEHMLKKYQSAEAIANQIEEGFEYFSIFYNQTLVGYVSILKENKVLFLSKIYVLRDYRGKKIGKTALQFIDDKAYQYGCNKIRLTVNKNNTNSINAYKKLGYINKGGVIKDIGKGFIMDDYNMEKGL